MARLCLIEKANKIPKFSTRKKSRCSECGRGRAFIRMFGLCRLCFRKYALQGYLPGVKKASW